MAADAERLVELGLTSYEAKAYLALVRRDSSAAADVARLARIPRQRIYDVLATLVEKGLASQRPGPPTKYAAVSPEFAIERLVLARREEMDRLERASKEMIELLTPAFAAGQKERDPMDYIEVLRDRAAINERFGELQGGIQDEILVFTKPPYATPAQENVEGLEVSATHRAKSVYEFSALDDPDFAAGVRRFIEAGEEARFVEHLPLKLVIIDETVVMFGMEDPVAGASELTIVVVEHRALAGVLKIAFEGVWEQGLTVDECLERRPKRRVRAA
jgi:HTH-type transcriptional regulator, sugar sensing transcriptional regulator